MDWFFNNIRKYHWSVIVLFFVCYITFYKPAGYSGISLFVRFDKIMHFAMYALFCSVMWYEYFKSHSLFEPGRSLFFVVVVPILFSGLLELFQSTLTTYRTGDFLDFFFNSLGVLFAAFFSMLVTRPLLKGDIGSSSERAVQ